METKCPFCGGRFNAAVPPLHDSKPCPNCGEYGIVELPSMNRKVCFLCHTEYDWKLKPNQKSVLIKGLKGEDNEP